MSSLGKCLFRSSVHFCDWVVCFLLLSCITFLYTLEIKPLGVASSANISSHSVGCLFFLFMVSFALQKLISSITAPMLIFGVISIALGD